MQSQAKTVEKYLAGLSSDRREVIEAVRKVILANLPEGYEEVMQYGMISYVVPLSYFPEGYLGRKNEPLLYLALASQKNYCALHLMCVYGNTEVNKWFVDAYKASGKKLDMGKACVQFKKLEDLPLELIGQVVARISMKDYVDFCKAAYIKRKDGAKRPGAN